MLVSFAAAAVLAGGTGRSDSLRLQPAVPATRIPTLPPEPTTAAEPLPPPVERGLAQEDSDQARERATPAPVAVRPNPIASPDSPPGRLSWSTSQQVRFSIKNNSSKTILAYDPQVRPQANTQDVPPGRFVGWQALWPVVDEQGQPLAPGTYTLLASTTADGLDQAGVTHRFQIR